MDPKRLVGLMIAVLPSLAVAADGGFTTIVTTPEITVFQRRQASSVELIAEGRIAAAPERVREVLLDYSHHTAWVQHVAESQLLARGQDWLVVYQRLGLPVIADRDFTLLVRYGGEATGRLWTRFRCANERGPGARHGVVRIATHEGGWVLDPVDGGRATRARYEVRLDLGGSLPRWMARGRAARDLPAFFTALRQRVATHP